MAETTEPEAVSYSIAVTGKALVPLPAHERYPGLFGRVSIQAVVFQRWFPSLDDFKKSNETVWIYMTRGGAAPEPLIHCTWAEGTLETINHRTQSFRWTYNTGQYQLTLYIDTVSPALFSATGRCCVNGAEFFVRVPAPSLPRSFFEDDVTSYNLS